MAFWKKDRDAPTTRAVPFVAGGALRDAAVTWFRTTNCNGPNSDLAAGVTDAIDRVIGGGDHLSILVPGDMSKSGKPYYSLTWADGFHTFELLPAQARLAGIESESLTIRPRSKRTDIHGPQVARLDHLSIERANGLLANRTGAGSVVANFLQGSRPDLVLRVAVLTAAATIVVALPVRAELPSGRLRFEFGPADDAGPFVGPMPVLVDLCFVNEDGPDRRYTVVSNTVSTLVDVIDPTRTDSELAPIGDDRYLLETAVNWFRAGCAIPASAGRATVEDRIEAILGEQSNVAILLPGELTRKGVAQYAITGGEQLFVFDLTRQQAGRCGLGADALRVLATSPRDQISVGQRRAEIGDLTIFQPGRIVQHRPITGTVRVLSGEITLGSLYLRQSFEFTGTRCGILSPIKTFDGSGLITIECAPFDDDSFEYSGPCPLVVDLCTVDFNGAALTTTVVSNSLGILLDIADGEPRRPLPPSQSASSKVPMDTAQIPVLDDAEQSLVRDVFEGAGIAFPGASADTTFTGAAPAGYLDCFMSFGDISGMAIAEDNRVLRAFNEESDSFPAAGGIVCGLTRWAPSEYPERRTARPFPCDRVIDLRWMFRDERSALRWFRNNLSKNSEDMPPLGTRVGIGTECHVFGGPQHCAGQRFSSFDFVSFNYLIVIGRVVAKVFLSEGDEVGLTEGDAEAVARRAAQRVSRAIEILS